MPIKYVALDLFTELAKLTIFSLAKIVPKQKNLWVFGAWKGEKYSDNSKYLFEYVCTHCPEIQPIWVTRNELAHELVKGKGYPVAYFGSLYATWKCMRAGVAIACVDLSQDLPAYAISTKTKRVQLWHGLGPKGYRFTNMNLLAEQGVRDMDSFSKVINKLVLIFAWIVSGKWYNGIKWLPYNLMLNQDLVVTTSELGVEKMQSVFGKQATRIEILGYPRHDALIRAADRKADQTIKVLYAPTHRTESQGIAIKMAKELYTALKKYPQIELLVKLHDLAKDNVENVQLLCERDIAQDIYTLLPQVDVLITDYSSIYTDYLLLNRPIIFTPFDLADYRDNDQGFFMDYDTVTPGPKAKSWVEAIALAATHTQWSKKYEGERKRTLALFHEVRDGNSCERIVERIKSIS